jgi:hypothetical protein
MADERTRQSMKSLRTLPSLRVVCRMAPSYISMVFIVSSYAKARIPLDTLSSGIAPEKVYLAPFAASSNRVMWLMKI